MHHSRMKILIVHPVMDYMGGGESLSCETVRVLLSEGHEVTLLSQEFDPRKIENRFGYDKLFDKTNLLLYPPPDGTTQLGSCSNLIHHIRGQRHALRAAGHSSGRGFDIIFSTQDEGYIPEAKSPIVQWGYFPKFFPNYLSSSLPKAMRTSPVVWHYKWNISRISLVLAISEYSKLYFDKLWKRPSIVVYPPCNMAKAGSKRNLIITAARATPEKRLELFWQVAESCPQYEFVMLLTIDPHRLEYSARLASGFPSNGKVILNAPVETYRRILGEAKVYIHCMEEERFGITIIEAMSAGCVPIVHDSGAPKEFVDDKVG